MGKYTFKRKPKEKKKMPSKPTMAFLVAQTVNNMPAMQEACIQSLD